MATSKAKAQRPGTRTARGVKELFHLHLQGVEANKNNISPIRGQIWHLGVLHKDFGLIFKAKLTTMLRFKVTGHLSLLNIGSSLMGLQFMSIAGFWNDISSENYFMLTNF